MIILSSSPKQKFGLDKEYFKFLFWINKWNIRPSLSAKQDVEYEGN